MAGFFLFAIEPNGLRLTLFLMNILIYAIGTRGDTQPYVALGRELRARGHEVTIAASKGFAGMIEGAGLHHAALPADFHELLQEPEFQAAFSSIKGRLKAFSTMSDIMNAQLQAVWDIAHELRPDVIGAHLKSGIAPYVGRALNVPVVPIFLQPGMMPTTLYPNFIMASKPLGNTGNLLSHKLIHKVMLMGTGKMVNRWVKASGAEIGPKMHILEGVNAQGLRIHAYSSTITPRDPSWPDSEAQPGYLFSEPEAYTPPPALSAFLEAGETPIYVGFGSMPGMDHARTTAALKGALAQTGLRAVLATGWGGIEAGDFGGQVHVLDAAPHTWLFPRMAGVVHHGGSGTTHEALRWGRPSMVCPFFADQPFFGALVARLGVAAQPVKQKNLTAESLARGISAMLEPDIARRAAALGEEIRAEKGCAGAADLLERVVA